MLIRGLMTNMSGSTGGVTAGHNKGGLYLRARSIPTNPNTIPQQRAKADFTIAVAQYGELTPEQRLAWEAFAQQQEHTNRLGESIQLSGQQQFVAINSALASAGMTAITVPPTPNTKPEAFTLDGTQAPNNTTNTIGTLNAGVLGSADRYVFGIGNPVGPGVRYYGGPYRIGGTQDGNAPGAAMSGAAYQAIADALGYTSGSFPLGQRIPIRIRAVRADGQYSAKTQIILGPTIAGAAFDEASTDTRPGAASKRGRKAA
jgi:hypothetical protein